MGRRDPAGGLWEFYKIRKYYPVFTDGGRCFCKRGLAYCGLYDLRIYERSQKGMGDHGNIGSLQRTGKQDTVHHGRPEDQCGGFNQCRTAFDAVSAILGIRRRSGFEGEASTALQFAAEAYEQQNLSNISQEQKENKDILLHETKERFVLNTQMLVQQITEAKMRGEDTGMLAYRFHQVLAEMITAACIKAKESSGRDKVALSGGVFQNRLLLRLTEERLLQEGFEVLRHRMIPPNDGGIAIGQAAYGMYQLQK